ncbi:MAG: class I SAM-dependent methyltransferase [Planctomycetota bacterium]|nr:class I SAM-dependent methyltransferase [Planctomycetota bacterium]
MSASNDSAELIEDISKSFNYDRKTKNAPGQFWYEHYPAYLSMYALLAIHRNECVIKLASGGDRLLDLGCGFGDLLYLMRDQYKSLHGVDPSDAMVKQSEANLRGRELDNDICIKRGLAENLDFDDQFFDTVLMLDVYEHVRPEFRVDVLKEVRRVMKPGAELLLATPSRAILHIWNFIDNFLLIPQKLWRREKIRLFSIEERPFTEVFCSKRELFDEVREAGFKIEAFERVGFYPAAENPGFLEPFLRRTYHRLPWLHVIGRRLFGILAKISMLNQKLLIRCVPDPDTAAVSAKSNASERKAA